MIMKCLLLIMLVFASDENKNVFENDTKSGKQNEAEQPVFVKIEEDDYANENKRSNYIGVSYIKKDTRWRARRWSKKEYKMVSNGRYRDEETAAHASDTLARKLMANGENDHKLNFPDDDIEVYAEERSSNYIGVQYVEKQATWRAQRHSKNEKKIVSNGTYKDEETAAHASDTLARKLMENGEENHRLNFPDDHTDVFSEEKKTSSIYIGVSYNESHKTWYVRRWSKKMNQLVYNGTYKDEETAAHASDTLARELMADGKQNHKLNFPDDGTEVFRENQTNKRKRSRNEDLGQFTNK